MPKEIKEEVTLKDAMTAIDLLREEVEKSSVDMDKVKKLEETLTLFENKSQEITKAEKKLEAQELEIKELVEKGEEMGKSMDEIMLELSKAKTINAGKIDIKETDEYAATKALFQSQNNGDQKEFLEALDKKFLRTDVDTGAGYLVPQLIADEILKEIEQISPMRSICRIRRIAGKSMTQPVRTSIPTATYEGEAETGTDSDSVYRNETIVPFRQTVTVGSTMDQLMNAAFDMNNEILSDANTGFAQGEALNFISGDGDKKPEGFLANTDITSNARETQTADKLDFDTVRLLQGDLKVGYNPVYVFNQKILALLRTLKGTNGQYLWQPAISERASNTIDGFRYVIMPDMPGDPASNGDLVTGEFVLAFGDFLRGYHIFDRTDISIIRDDSSPGLRKAAIIEWTLNRWNTGQTVISEAIKAVKIKQEISNGI